MNLYLSVFPEHLSGNLKNVRVWGNYPSVFTLFVQSYDYKHYFLKFRLYSRTPVLRSPLGLAALEDWPFTGNWGWPHLIKDSCIFVFIQ